jgi:eukaryotic-like serine/threonine-protein kinase
MNKIIGLIFAILLSVTPCSWAEDKVYTNAVLNFTMTYPSEWELREMMNAIAFLSAKESEGDTFRENVNILMEDVSSSPMSLDQYMEISNGNIAKMIEGYKLIEKGEITLSNEKGYFSIFEGNANNYYLRFKSYTFMKGTKVYTLTYTALPESFDKFLPAAEGIVKSISLK